MSRTDANHFANEVQTAATFFTSKGWQVEMGTRDELVAIQTQELQCGDGRYANIPGGKAGRAIFGATWGVMALKTGGDEKGLQAAVKLVREQAMVPAVHGDHHGKLACGLFNLWKNDQVPGAFPLELPTDEETLLALLKQNGMPITELPGAHEETKVTISFATGLVPKLDKNTFRLDGTLREVFGIPFEAYYGSIIDAVGKLTQGKVSTIRLIHSK